MRMRFLSAVFVLPLALVAQQTSPKPATPAAEKAATEKAAAPGLGPHTKQPSAPASWKDIKFPPLKPIKIPQVEESTLPNGMKIYLLENHELPLISGLALVRTGNLFDPADKVGLATVTGNVIRSGGTSNKAGDQIDEQLENIAASVESQIGESYGTVSFSMLKENTDEVLGTFHDVLTDAAFREDKIALVETQLRSGISRRNDDAHGISQREFSDLLYGSKTPYGWQIEYATLNNIKRDDIVGFYKRYYFPANVILAVQGDFSAPQMKARIEKLFASWNVTQTPVPVFPKVDSHPKPGVYVAAKTDVTQTSFSLGSLGGLLSDKDYPALQVMADILGGGFRSRLFQKVRTQLGYAYDISADWGANFDHPGLFEIAGSTKSASTTEALQAVQKELQRIRAEEVTADELETAKQTVVNSFVFNFDTPAKTLNRLLTYRYFGYPDDFIFEYQKAVQKVTRADILRVAKQYIDPANLVIVAVGNPKDYTTPLSKLGMPVSELDLTIPEPKSESAPKDLGSVKDGLALLMKLQRALGGAEKLASVNDFETKVNVEVAAAAGGLKAAQTEQWLKPAIFRQENVLPFGKVVSYFDGSGGWLSTPQGLLPLQEPQKQQIELELFRSWFSLALSDRIPGRTVTVNKAGSLVISDDHKHSVTLTLNSATGLPTKELYQLGGSEVVEEFSDWQETSGIQLPHKTNLTRDGKKYLDSSVTAMKLNAGLTQEQMSKKP